MVQNVSNFLSHGVLGLRIIKSHYIEEKITITEPINRHTIR